MKILIRNMDEFRQAVTLSGDLEYDTLVPSLRAAQEYVGRYTGLALLTELESDELTTVQKELLAYVYVPIASLALFKFVNSGNVRVTDLGVMRTKTADSGDAFEWQVERAASTFRQSAFDGIEALLRFLETKLTDFPAYTASDAYKQDKGKLIRSAEVFNQYYEIGSSRLVLQTLQAAMRTTEVTRIRPILGDSLTGLLGADLTAEQELQLDMARRALVYGTIARALRERLVSITDTGVQVNGLGTIRYQQPASDKQILQTQTYFDEQAAATLSELVTITSPAPETATGNRVLGSKIVSF